MPRLVPFLCVLLLSLSAFERVSAAAEDSFDVVVYDSTPGGVMAAVAGTQENRVANPNPNPKLNHKTTKSDQHAVFLRLFFYSRSPWRQDCDACGYYAHWWNLQLRPRTDRQRCDDTDVFFFLFLPFLFLVRFVLSFCVCLTVPMLSVLNSPLSSLSLCVCVCLNLPPISPLSSPRPLFSTAHTSISPPLSLSLSSYISPFPTHPLLLLASSLPLSLSPLPPTVSFISHSH